MSENALNILSEDAFVEQTEKIISALKDKNIERKPLVFDDIVLIWNDLDDGVYVAQNTGVIADNGDGLTLNKNDILLKIGNVAYVYAQSYASKVTCGKDGAYSSYSYSITAEQLEELIEEIYGGGGGGAPAEHKHSIDDIYTAVKLGGEWHTNLSVIHKDLSEAVRLNEELLQWLNDGERSVEDFVEDYATRISGGSPITDSTGKNWFPMMLNISNIVLKTKLSPNSSIYDIQYGSVIKIAGEIESPEDLDKLIVTPSDKIINVTIANTQLENKTVTDKIELFTLLSENLRPETPEEVDALVEKYSNSAIAVTIQPVQEDGERIDIDSMSFNDFMESEIASMFMTVVFILVSEDTLAPIMGDDETESMKQFKLRFDEVEGETVYKTPLSDELAEQSKSINDLKTSDVDMNRVVKKTTEWYGGDKINTLAWLFNYNVSKYENGSIFEGTDAYNIGEKMSDGHSYDLQRIKMGSVFELNEYEDDKTKEIIRDYTYLGTASELNGLSYQVYTDWGQSEQRSEKFVISLDEYLDEQGRFEFIQEHIDTLNELEVMFITIVDANSNARIYGISKETPESDTPVIHIDEIIPYQKEERTDLLSNIIYNMQGTAERAQDTANNAQNTAESAQYTANQAQSIAEQAENTANQAQSIAEQAENTANQAQNTLAERYTNAEINNLVSSIPKFAIKVVASLPTSNISTTTVYLLAKQNQEPSNLYTEYIYVDNKWEKLGEQVVDLSDYFTKQQTQTAINTAVANFLTETQIQTKIDTAIASFLTETQIRTIVHEMIDTATNKMVESNTITDIEKMTESEYEALETKSETTMYAVVDDEVVENA